MSRKLEKFVLIGLVVLLLLQGLWLWWESSRPKQVDGPRTREIGSVRTQQGLVQRKGRYSIQWEELESQSAVHERDSLLTGPGAQAVVDLADSGELALAENTLVEVEESPDAHLELRLVEGQLRGRLPPKTRLRLRDQILEPKNSSAEVQIVNSLESTSIQVQSGELQVGERIVKAGDRLELPPQSPSPATPEPVAPPSKPKRAAKKPPAQKSPETPPPPQLKAPQLKPTKAPQSRQVVPKFWKIAWHVLVSPLWAREVEVMLAWEKVPKSTEYRIEIASDAEFQKILRSEVLYGTEFNYRTGDRAEFYWRVATGRKGVFGEPSAAQKVQIRELLRAKEKMFAIKRVEKPWRVGGAFEVSYLRDPRQGQSFFWGPLPEFGYQKNAWSVAVQFTQWKSRSSFVNDSTRTLWDLRALIQKNLGERYFVNGGTLAFTSRTDLETLIKSQRVVVGGGWRFEDLQIGALTDFTNHAVQTSWLYPFRRWELGFNAALLVSSNSTAELRTQTQFIFPFTL